MSKKVYMDSLEARFPRMMSLYKAYKACSSKEADTIFNRIQYELEHAAWAYEEYEELLARLSNTDFEYFIIKILSRGKADAIRGYHQFEEMLNELRGYAYLQDKGYNEIELIKDSNEMQTPDVGAFKCGQLDCVLEVKTINVSNDDRAIWDSLGRAESRRMRRDKYGIPDGMKEKIKDSLSRAKTQVTLYFPSLQIRRIVYLVIKMDADYASGTHNWSELGEFIGELNSTEEKIEVLHEGIGLGKYARKDLEPVR